MDCFLFWCVNLLIAQIRRRVSGGRQMSGGRMSGGRQMYLVSEEMAQAEQIQKT